MSKHEPEHKRRLIVKKNNDERHWNTQGFHLKNKRPMALDVQVSI
jgi:hypothetical protein